MVEAALAVFAVQKPEPQEIVTLFAEQPFTADTVQGRQHTGLEQLLRRNAAPAYGGVEFIKQRGELLQHGVHVALYGPQRMVRRHGGIEVNHRQKVRLGLRFSTHISLTFPTLRRSNKTGVFQQPASELIYKGATTLKSNTRQFVLPHYFNKFLAA